MRFLVDENLSPRVAALIRDSGLDATHVLEHGLGGAPDTRVAALAVAESRTIISSDSDFSTLLSLSRATSPSLVLLRSATQLKPPAQAALLLANLPTVESDLAMGAVVSLGRTRIRVRPLPLNRAVPPASLRGR
jgi:predicted nuclease of predicted toxin-antitoxin system